MIRPAFTAMGLALLAGSAAASAGGSAVLPFDLTVEVVWGRPAGPESFREELAREIATAIGLRGCFGEVRRERPEQPGPRDLLLEVLVDGYEEELRFDAMIHQRTGSDLDVNRQRTAELDAMFWLEVRTLEDPVSVRRKHFRRRVSWRPLNLEDPREVVLEQVIEGAARHASLFACKGSVAKWLEQIERARRDAAR